MRAGCSSTSGSEANSTKSTVMTPSAAGMGEENGSLLVWLPEKKTISSKATVTRVVQTNM